MTQLRILNRFCPARALSCKITVRNIELERPVISVIRWLSWRNWIVNIRLIKESSGTERPFQKFVQVWWHYLFMSRRSHNTDFQGQVFRSVTKLRSPLPSEIRQNFIQGQNLNFFKEGVKSSDFQERPRNSQIFVLM